MTEAIIVALITGGLSLLGVIITSNKTTRDSPKLVSAKSNKKRSESMKKYWANKE